MAIVISVITLSKKLGLPMPWLRLSVIGSMSYETIAANNALSAMGQSLGSAAPLTAQQYVNVLLVMTISIMVGIWLVPAIGKKLQNGMSSLSNRDAKWADIFQNSLFIGMISAFVGFVFCDVSRLWTAENGVATEITSGFAENGDKIEIPVNYFPDDDDTKEPVVRWRSGANLLYSNWLNYFVYQSTPYDIGAIGK